MNARTSDPDAPGRTFLARALLARAWVVVFLLLSVSASGSLGVISLEELSDRADLIVHGTVVSVESAISERETPQSHRKLPISIASARIVPIRILKGSDRDPLVVTAVENMEDSPRFLEDQEVFLFLNRNEDDLSYSTVGLIQGKFDVLDGLVVREQTTVDQFIARLDLLIR